MPSLRPYTDRKTYDTTAFRFQSTIWRVHDCEPTHATRTSGWIIFPLRIRFVSLMAGDNHRWFEQYFEGSSSASSGRCWYQQSSNPTSWMSCCSFNRPAISRIVRLHFSSRGHCRCWQTIEIANVKERNGDKLVISLIKGCCEGKRDGMIEDF